MAPTLPPEDVATDPAITACERDGRAAFAVDRNGALLWAGDAARALIGPDGLDEASRSVLARVARVGAPTLLRLRFGPAGASARVFRARPGAAGDKATTVEAVEPIPAPAPPPAEPIAQHDGPASPEPAETHEPAAEAIRFVFEFDRQGRLAFLSPDLEAAVGASAREAIGRPWSETAAALGFGADDAVSRALVGASAWTDAPVAWPLADGRRLPLVLSALPMFDAGRALVGFRGLGRSAGQPEPEPAETPTDEAAPEPIADAPEPAAEALAEPAVFEPRLEDDLDAWNAEAAAEPPSAVISDPPPAARALGLNVVPIRGCAPAVEQLTTTEENAFDEIARRLRSLGVRTSATPDLDPRDEPAAAPWLNADGEETGAGDAPSGASAEELLRLLDRLPLGALALKRGGVAYANRAALDLFGHADIESLAARDADTLFAEPPPREDGATATVRLVRQDGGALEAEARLAAIVWEGEAATLMALRRPEDAAARAAIERERETSAILDTATDGVLTLDGTGRILSMNRSAEALFGVDAADLAGTLFTLSLAPESRRAAFDYLDRIRENGVAAVMNDGREVLGLVRQGGAIPLYMTLGRIGAPDADRFCAVLRDVTPWKKAEEELLAAKRQAERASAQKSEFLTKVSHEIRTPLNAIIGFAEVMMEERFGPVGSPRYKDYLRDIHVSGGHLVGLVNDLVDIARIESGGLKLEPAPVDLNEIAAQAAALLQPQANREHVIIRTSLARGMPPVMADRRSVRQIMTALTANAVKLSRPGGQVIVATSVTDMGQAVIRVRDAGAGMAREDLATALEPFRPLGVRDDRGGGANLGLPLAKALAEANEATLALSSEPGHGTLAEVTFPAARVLAN